MNLLVLRQLRDPASGTCSYLVADAVRGEALLIDPVFEQFRRDAALVRELGLRLLATLETHLHADHVTGAWLHRAHAGSRILLAAAAGAEGADRQLAHGDRVPFGARHVEVRATPGHTAGCVSYVLDDQTMAFTGDALLIRGCGRTDFQQGDARRLYRSVHGQILNLPDACLLYPGHDYRGLTVSSVAEERQHNPRLGGGIGEDDFVATMQQLALPHPKLIEIALPANRRCGRPEGDQVPPTDPDWATLTWTFAGLWEIEPQALEEAGAAVQRVDVREADEFNGPLGHLRGALLLPLGTLQERLDTLDRGRPVVTICRSGARSARAALMLSEAGFPAVANLAGGMLRWRAQASAVVGGQD